MQTKAVPYKVQNQFHELDYNQNLALSVYNLYF